MDLRTRVQHIIDELQFRFDVWPTLYYQPLPWLGFDTAKRGAGTVARWTAIEASIRGLPINSALDIGCNVGYFCFSLAAQGIPALGIDQDDRFLRIAQHAARKLAARHIAADKVGFCHLTIDRSTVRLLPQVDLILLLSVWHHWVRAYGLPTASEMLAAVWAKADQALFFETGEAEMPPEFGLSMLKISPRDWLEDYLSAICADSTVRCLGAFKAFAPRGDETHAVVHRNLFMISRRSTGALGAAATLAFHEFAANLGGEVTA